MENNKYDDDADFQSALDKDDGTNGKNKFNSEQLRLQLKRALDGRRLVRLPRGGELR